MVRRSAKGSAQRVVLIAVILACWPAAAAVVPYDIVYVRQARFGANTNTTVELRRRDDPTRCWAVTFPGTQRNSAKTFRARLARTGG